MGAAAPDLDYIDFSTHVEMNRPDSTFDGDKPGFLYARGDEPIKT